MHHIEYIEKGFRNNPNLYRFKGLGGRRRQLHYIHLYTRSELSALDEAGDRYIKVHPYEKECIYLVAYAYHPKDTSTNGGYYLTREDIHQALKALPMAVFTKDLLLNDPYALSIRSIKCLQTKI